MANSTEFDIPDSENFGCNSEKDGKVWDMYDNLFQEFPHSEKHLISLFPVYSRRIHLTRFLAHYELFKRIINLPGSIVEMGIYRGGSFFVWHKLLEIFLPTETSRKVFGFDRFQGLFDLNENDGKTQENVGKSVEGWNAGPVEKEVFQLCDIHNVDSVLSKRRSQIIKGDILETLDKFLEDNPGVRISLLHVDVDLHDVTKFVLDKLYDKVVPGGLIVFDEYAYPPWEGETRALEGFLKERGLKVKIEKFPWSLSPGGFFVKE
jgi:SAM-dependent methyltransferase